MVPVLSSPSTPRRAMLVSLPCWANSADGVPGGLTRISARIMWPLRFSFWTSHRRGEEGRARPLTSRSTPAFPWSEVPTATGVCRVKRTQWKITGPSGAFGPSISFLSPFPGAGPPSLPSSVSSGTGAPCSGAGPPVLLLRWGILPWLCHTPHLFILLPAADGFPPFGVIKAICWPH